MNHHQVVMVNCHHCHLYSHEHHNKPVKLHQTSTSTTHAQTLHQLLDKLYCEKPAKVHHWGRSQRGLRARLSKYPELTCCFRIRKEKEGKILPVVHLQKYKM